MASINPSSMAKATNLNGPPATLIGLLRQRLHDATLSTKLLLATGFVIVPALVATVAVLAYASYIDQAAYFESDLEKQTKVAAESISAATLFDNRAETADILRSVFAPTTILEAQVFNASGIQVSSYSANGKMLNFMVENFSAIENSTLPKATKRHIETISYRGQIIGNIVVIATLQPLQNRMISQLQRTIFILAIFCGMALLLARSLVARVVAPVPQLAELMDHISKNQDYAARATVTSRDEIGQLAGRFNGLLVQIQSREADLQLELAERRSTELRLAHLAATDLVTGLNNRHFFYDRLREYVAQTQENAPSQYFGLIFIDLDNFKVVNDSLGHSAGDTLLAEFGQRLKSLSTDGDVVCRVGGDEFAVIVNSPATEAVLTQAAQKIMRASAAPMFIEGNEITVTVSIGLAIFSDWRLSAEALVRNADTAMYSAKRAGKNTYALFSPAMTVAAEQRFRIEAGLRRAIERQEFSLVFQPIVDLQNHTVVKAEALLRWRTDDRVVPPLEFIAIAEETGLITTIGDFVIRQACKTLQTWHTLGLNLSVAVNVSARQLANPQFADSVIAALRQYNLPPHALEIELTESMLVTAIDPARAALDTLEAYGIHLSIDDFGTGYSSLAYLSHLAVDGIKIDKSLIDELPTNPENVAITKAILGMARGLGARVVAEGVETIEQANALRELGCTYAQGFLFSKPIDAALMQDVVREMPQWGRRSIAVVATDIGVRLIQ
jgi:diguanylate cyclase (GGDEF)-like protein